MSNYRLDLIAEMLEKNPDDTFLNYAAALEHKKKGEIRKAIKIFKKIIQNDPEYLPTYYQLGRLLEETNKTDAAIDVYSEGIALAKKKKDVKAMGELSEALLILDVDAGQAW